MHRRVPIPDRRRPGLLPTVAPALLLAAGTVATAAVPTPVGAQSQRERVTVEVGARNPAVSPDGTTLAVSVLGDVFTLPLTGGDATTVTEGQAWDRHPAWSPDGRFLAFSRWTDAGSDLRIRNLATGLERSIVQVPAEILRIRFDPSGERVYYIVQRNQYEAHLWRTSLASGAEPEQLTFTEGWHEWSFALSPEGDRVLLETGRYEGTDLFELDPETKKATRAGDTPERETAVAWSPDGGRWAYVARRNGVDRVVVAPAGDGAPREVHRFPYGQTELEFAPDGSLVVSSARRLYRLDPESRDLTPIPFRAAFERAADPDDDLAIHDVRLFDAVSDTLMDDAWVLIRNGRIAAVGTGDPDVPEGVATIDGEGRTLLPGLMDNHYHFWWPQQGAELLARGVTSIRDPGVAIADGMDYKDASRLGLVPAPTVFSSGPLLDGPEGYHPMVDVSLDDPDAAAPLVRALKDQGVDALKAYFLLEPDVLAAVVAEADRQGIPVTGHIGVRTSWREALDAGISGFNHIRVWRDFLDPGRLPDGSDGSLDSSRDRVSRMQADWTGIDPDSPEVEALVERLATTGTAIDPTVYIQRIPESARSGFSLEEFGRAEESFERMKRFVAKAVEAGVPLLAGTDNVRLNDELETYAEAGVPHAEILRAATVNGARWLGVADELGTVEPGRRAHLLLVDGDPLEDIEALREVDLVLKDGVVVFRRGR